MHFKNEVGVLYVMILVSIISARAPEDGNLFCTNELLSSGTIPPSYPPNSKILLDSYNYVNLLPPQDGAVWQEVDNDNNNEAGRGTEVRVCNRQCSSLLYFSFIAVDSEQQCSMSAGCNCVWV